MAYLSKEKLEKLVKSLKKLSEEMKKAQDQIRNIKPGLNKVRRQK